MGEFRALLALGSNLPFKEHPPARVLAQAIAALAAQSALTLRAQSAFYATPCFPADSGPDYVNACLEVSVSASDSGSGPRTPEELLALLHQVEHAFGRERTQRWGGRTLDIDLLAIEDRVRPSLLELRRWVDLPAHEQTRKTPSALILPHPRLHERAFVLAPLAEIAPGWRHPLTGLSVREMLAKLPASERRGVRKILPPREKKPSTGLPSPSPKRI